MQRFMAPANEALLFFSLPDPLKKLIKDRVGANRLINANLYLNKTGVA